MILGVGIDIVEVSRVEQSIAKLGRRFIERIASPCELEEAPSRPARRSEYWAVRFAAKEAFAKALGTGMGSIVAFDSIGVTKDANGKPGLEYSADLRRVLRRRGVRRSHVSLSHTHEYATAVVILEGNRK